MLPCHDDLWCGYKRTVWSTSSSTDGMVGSGYNILLVFIPLQYNVTNQQWWVGGTQPKQRGGAQAGSAVFACKLATCSSPAAVCFHSKHTQTKASTDHHTHPHPQPQTTVSTHSRVVPLLPRLLEPKGYRIHVLQVASARFARFSYCGHGFARFTSYGKQECMIEVVKPNMCMVFTRFSYCGLGFARSACFTLYANQVSVHYWSD